MLSKAFHFFALIAICLGQSALAKPPPEMTQLSTGSDIATWVIPAKDPKHVTPIIYLHGGPGLYTEDRRLDEASVFRDLGFNTIFFDQAGGGMSPHLAASDYNIDRAVLDLEALRIQLGHEKVILWGNSYGATLAAVYASRFPDRVSALIFTSPGAFPGTKPKRNYKPTDRGRLKPSKEVKEALRIIDKMGSLGESKLSQVKAGLIFDKFVSAQLMAGMTCKETNLELAPLAGGGNFYANRLIQKSIESIKFEPGNLPVVPTLIVRGNCDFLSMANAEFFATYFGSDVKQIPDSGHGLLASRVLVDSVFAKFAQDRLVDID